MAFVEVYPVVSTSRVSSGLLALPFDALEMIFHQVNLSLLLRSSVLPLASRLDDS